MCTLTPQQPYAAAFHVFLGMDPRSQWPGESSHSGEFVDFDKFTRSTSRYCTEQPLRNTWRSDTFLVSRKSELLLISVGNCLGVAITGGDVEGLVNGRLEALRSAGFVELFSVAVQFHWPVGR